jgi:glutamate carboxypeptidase
MRKLFFISTFIFATSLTFAQDFESNFVAAITELSSINSGSKNEAGLNTVADKMVAALQTLNFSTQWDYSKRSLSAIKPATAEKKKTFLLVYHLDTVFEADHSFQKVSLLQKQKHGGPILSGPGVSDDKGGFVMILENLRRFQNLDENKFIEWRVFGAADEELGSEISKNSLLEFAKGVDLALVFEPGWYDDETKCPHIPMTIGGNAILDWQVTGVEAHTGIAFEKGRSAIKAMADHILYFENLTDPQREVFFNVGTIDGGTKLNVRPGHAHMRLGIRYRYPEDENFIQNSVQDAKKKFEKDGIQIQETLTFKWHPQNIGDPDLLKDFQDAAAKLGQPVPTPAPSLARSASSILMEAKIPTLDSMGAYGDHYHSDEEILYVGSALPRLELIELFLRDQLKKVSR